MHSSWEPHVVHPQLVKHRLQTAQRSSCVPAPAITLKGLLLSQSHKEMVRTATPENRPLCVMVFALYS